MLRIKQEVFDGSWPVPSENPETENHLHQVKEEPSYEIQYFEVPDDQPYPAEYTPSTPDSASVKKTVPKRDRSNGCKRWTRETTTLLLNFIKDHPEKLEKPTAQMYYKKIANSVPKLSEYSWTGMRDKVRYLRCKYKQARDWRNSNGFGLLQPDETSTMQDYIMKICPEFQVCEIVFGNKSEILLPTFNDSSESMTPMSPASPEVPTSDAGFDKDDLEPDSALYEKDALADTPPNDHPPPSLEDSPVTIPSASKKRMLQWMGSSPSNRNPSLLRDVQKSRTQYLVDKQRFEENYLRDKQRIEAKQHEDLMELKKHQLEVERQKMAEEVRLKEIELKGKLELDKMELEKKMELDKFELERKMELMKYELELKYRSKHSIE